MEAGVVLGKAWEPLYWHVPPQRSVAYLPDSRPLWEVLWEHREVLRGVAHSHPGGGLPYPSYEDLSTFAAVESGLGKRLEWPIISDSQLVICHWANGEYQVERQPEEGHALWIPQLRAVSY